ncbi:hypothetical protein [Glaciecola sp. KUL10]|uniref:hypothetical protein n=1 Tax=Glaciecola sp. (strain KUL10) TaxID=2161813 RepID=UPI000D782FC4|nr:hypothetical protein [Glaciecola sp. KUL10]GBL05516.1 3-oxoacyl-[acyl-carrier-protein] reductase [Glaciecola sp. KUL10]
MQDKYKTEKPIGRPEALKKGFNAAAALVESGISSDLLAKRVVEALNNKQMYIFTHPNYRESVQKRSAYLDMAFADAENSPLVGHLKDDEIAML